MKAYKGFKSDMTCRGFQYEEDKTYETDSAVLCKSGFHACENPIDVFNYYPPCDKNGNLNKFHEVELEDVSSERSDDTKVVAKKIKIGKELNFNDITKAHIEWAKNNIDKNNKAVNSGDSSSAVNSGDSSSAVNSGDSSSAVNSGDCSIAVNSGRMSSAINNGLWSSAVSSGNFSNSINSGSHSSAVSSGGYSNAVNSGKYSNAVNSGNYSKAVNSGFRSSAVNSGNSSCAINNGNRSGAISLGRLSSAINNGKDGIAIAWGCDSKAKAEKGSYIVLTEWIIDEENIELILKNAKMAYVDGEKIKANTFYKLENGEFVEVK